MEQQLTVQVYSHLLVLRGVTAPVSFTNLEKSLAKSAPAKGSTKSLLFTCGILTQRFV